MRADLWERLTSVQPALPAPVVLATAATAVLLVLVPGVWPVARHVVTVAHEGAHAVVAVLAGRRLTGIRLHSDTSGLTVSRGRPQGPGMVLTLAAGYPGPALLGLGSAALLRQHRPVLLLWVLLVLLALLLVQIRNIFGLWVVLVCAAGVFAVTWWGGPTTQSAVAHTMAWFLLLGAPRTVVELAASRRGGRGRSSDADQLGRLSHLPGGVWVAFLGVVTVGAAVLGASWLVPDLLPGALLSGLGTLPSGLALIPG